MRQVGIYVVYEYDIAYRPHASAYIRLLRPLSYPTLAREIHVSQGLSYDQSDADLVVVDRLWRPDITPGYVETLVESVRRSGARLVYALDDNLMDLPTRPVRVGSHDVLWPKERHRESIALLLKEADAVWVTTPNLRDRVISENTNVSLMPNMLDERLLVQVPGSRPAEVIPGQRLTIGYMGTPTHDADLRMVLPALQAVCDHHHDRISIEIVGGIENPDLKEHLTDLPVRYLKPAPAEHEYPYFMLWFTRLMRWDLAIAPLQASQFNECKSDIKFLDYAAIGAAPVCSKVPAYTRTVRHGETGWLVENDVEAWTEALERLLVDADLRHRLSRAATDYLYGDRILAVGVGNWTQAVAHAIGG